MVLTQDLLIIQQWGSHGFFSYSLRKRVDSSSQSELSVQKLIIKSDRERQISYDIAYTEAKKNGTNEPIYKTEIESQM